MTEPIDVEDAQPVPADIVAHRGTYYRNTRILVVTMAIGAGLWFLYDGYIGWPNYNARVDSASPADQQRMDKKHQDKDIEIQRELAAGLLPLGVLMTAWFLFNSRGAYRLRGGILQVPGHPPVPLEKITVLDMAKWERKGIAFVNYSLASGESGRARLDDFIYERKPTDEIVETIRRVRPSQGDDASTTEDESETESQTPNSASATEEAGGGH